MESINFASPNISINNFEKQIMDDGICNSNQRENANLYSFPGILHFLQAEWNKMETERAHWDIEKAELMAKIAFLQGEKKGQESLKEDLVRRIKMLEYALKQKNQTINELKYGVSKANNNGAMLDASKNNADDPSRLKHDTQIKLSTDVEKAKIASSEWRESRQRLRQFLQEVGYVDTIVDARQIRLRNILSDGFFSKLMDDQSRSKHIDESLTDVENSISKTFDFLGPDKDKPNKGDEVFGEGSNFDNKKLTEDESAWLNQLSNRFVGPNKAKMVGKDDKQINKGRGFPKTEKIGRFSKNGPELKDLLAQLSDESMHNEDSGIDKVHEEERNDDKRSLIAQNNDMESYGNSFGLGDLASITVTNDADNDGGDASKGYCGGGGGSSSAVSGSDRDGVDGGGSETLNTLAAIDNGASKKYWNVKYTLRGHFDSVRCMSFYNNNESALITGSDDGTVKVWSFNKAQLSKRAPNTEIEAVQTMRGHDGAVLATKVLGADFCAGSAQLAVSGGLDGSMRVWTLPSLEIDPYELYDRSQNALCVSDAHSDPIWAVDSINNDSILMTASTTHIKLWSITAGDSIANLSQDIGVHRGLNVAAHVVKEIKLCDLLPDNTSCRITTASILKNDSNQLVVGTSTGQLLVIDLQSESVKLLVDMSKSDSVVYNSCNEQGINSVAGHPTLPLIFCGHEDHYLRTVDLRSSSMVHSMVVHQDAVSCVDIDHNGMYLITGSHDGSLRVWDMDKKSCIQEMASHRVKNNESVHDVAFHAQMAYIGSCGAEGVVKIYS